MAARKATIASKDSVHHVSAVNAGPSNTMPVRVAVSTELIYLSLANRYSTPINSHQKLQPCKDGPANKWFLPCKFCLEIAVLWNALMRERG